MDNILQQLGFISEIGVSPFQGALLIFGLFIVLLLARLYFTWRKIKILDGDATKAWNNINTLLTQRNNEIPKLIQFTKNILKNEPKTNEKLVEARRHVKFACEARDIGKLGISEGMLKNALHHVFKLSEHDAEMMQDKKFLQLRSRILGLENAIRDRREFYNRSVREGNQKIDTFLGGMIANIFNIEDKEELKLSKAELSVQDLTTMFSS